MTLPTRFSANFVWVNKYFFGFEVFEFLNKEIKAIYDVYCGQFIIIIMIIKICVTEKWRMYKNHG